MKRLTLFFFSFLLLTVTACAQDQDVSVDRHELLRDVRILASDALEGRYAGSVGSRMAQEFIIHRFEELELKNFGESYKQYFDHTHPETGEEFEDAVNLIGYLEGSEYPERFIVLTAHYDHLGVQNGEIYNGADDNASGVGGLLAAARWFSEHQLENSILFIAFDAEEQRLGGARYFVQNPVVLLEKMVLNINMDMISTNFENELYAVGTYHYEYLKPMIEESTDDSPLDVLFGYDSDEWDQDWTLASDHGAFHEVGIPFIYFGVEDHPHYHQPTDTFENINPDFYLQSVTTIIKFIRDIDGRLDEVVEASGR